MKLKNKLAREAYQDVKNGVYQMEGRWFKVHFLTGFEMGFEKAREMASFLAAHSWTDVRYIGKSYTSAVKAIGDDILSLGEDEVE